MHIPKISANEDITTERFLPSEWIIKLMRAVSPHNTEKETLPATDLYNTKFFLKTLPCLIDEVSWDLWESGKEKFAIIDQSWKVHEHFLTRFMAWMQIPRNYENNLRWELNSYIKQILEKGPIITENAKIYTVRWWIMFALTWSDFRPNSLATLPIERTKIRVVSVTMGG